jgi:diguanylate cyclase (GGDEF)-like protein
MWKLLQRTTNMSIPPPERPLGLRTISRLWRPAPRPLPAPAPVRAEPKSTVHRKPLELQPESEADTEPLQRQLPEPSPDYANSLLLLKSQHAALSAERTELDHAGERQRERGADLEARLHFLLRTLQARTTADLLAQQQPFALDMQPTPAPPWHSTTPVSSESPTGRFRIDPLPETNSDAPLPRTTPVLVTVPVPVEAYRSAIAAAQHWQAQAEALERQLRAVSQLVRIDSLTGLHNRRSFDEHLPRSVARAQRVEESLCLLMIDIDHFKHLNDRHGHSTGDAVLVDVARRLRETLREEDLIVRWGGEEFLVIVQALAPEQVDALAQRMLGALESAPVVAGTQRIAVTASIGFATFPIGPGSLRVPWERAINLVDTAMYLAKAHGRNRAYGVRLLQACDETALDAITHSLESAWRGGQVALTLLQGRAALAVAA